MIFFPLDEATQVSNGDIITFKYDKEKVDVPYNSTERKAHYLLNM